MPELKLNLLGSTSIEVNQGAEFQPRLAKVMALLAFLAVERGIHSRATLASLLWAERSEKDARRNLTKTITRIRKEIKDSSKPSDYFQINRPSIGLSDDAPLVCDATEFSRFFAAVESHPHEKLIDCDDCLEKLAAAVGLVRGEFLAGFSIADSALFDEWLLLKREQFYEQQLQALSALTEGALARESWGMAQRFARQQLQLEAWREQAHRQLMQALAMDGQRENAIAQFERCERILQTEMGIGPSAETLALLDAIRTDSLNGSDNDLASVPQQVLSNLPTNPTKFIGRDEEIGAVCQRINQEQNRLITLLGSGGIGKTRLSVEVGRRLLEAGDGVWDGVYFVSLVGVDSAENIAPTIANACDFTPSGLESTLDQLTTFFGDKRVLLIIDNFEQLMDGVPKLMKLLSATRNLHLLVTSRERLNLMAEDLIVLRGLNVPQSENPLATADSYSAVRLFVECAYRRHKQFRLNEATWPSVRKICRLLEGLPLGIELAATWIDEMTCAEIAANIASDLDILETDIRDIAPHHRSLRLVYDRTWVQLSQSEQDALLALSVMRGNFSTAAASTIANISPLVLRRLRNKSLIGLTDTRWNVMHTLLRQFAANKLAEQPSAERQAEQAHATYYASLLEEQAAVLTGSNPGKAIRLLSQTSENAIAAWHWARLNRDVGLLNQMVDGLSHYHEARVLFFEIIELLQQVVDELTDPFEESHPEIFGRFLMYLTAAICNLDYQAASEMGRRAVACATKAQAWDVLAQVYHDLGRVQLHVDGGYAEARRLFELGINYAEQAENQTILGDLKRNLGNTYRQQGDYEKFLQLLKQSLASYQHAQNLGREQLVLYWLSAYNSQSANLGEGMKYIQAPAMDDELINDPYIEAGIHISKAVLSSHFGQYDEATQLLRKALQEYENIKMPWQISHTLVKLGVFESKRGEHRKAIAIEQRALAVAEKHSLNELVAFSRTGLGYVYAAANKLNEAQATYLTAKENWQVVGRKESLVELEAALANIAQRQNRLDDAQQGVLAILPDVLTLPLHSTFEPLLIYWHCYSVLKAIKHPDAIKCLHAANLRLQRMADSLENDVSRQQLLQKVELHRLISAESDTLLRT